jgi:RluA family pseudouridine synthase
MDTIVSGEHSIPVICDTPDLLAVDKPVGLASIPERNPENVSLLRILTEALNRKLYVVHRLDKQVSGLILFAKTPEFHRYMNLQFEHRHVRKTYLALVHGSVPEGGRIDLPLRRCGSGRMAEDPVSGKPCRTDYEVLERRPEATLLKVRPLTGRKHQIRAHLFAVGHPIVGDPLYGDKRVQRSFSRLMLHALSLEFTRPDGTPEDLRTPVPAF